MIGCGWHDVGQSAFLSVSRPFQPERFAFQYTITELLVMFGDEHYNLPTLYMFITI